MKKTYKTTSGNINIHTRKDTIEAPVIQDIPGVTTEPLIPGINVRGEGNSGGGVYFGKTSINTWAIGDVSITGVGFQPSFVQIKGFSTGSRFGVSDGYSDANGGRCFFYNSDSGGYETTKIVRVRESWPRDTIIASLVSLDSDGFTLNVTELNIASDTHIFYICYP